MLKIPTIEEMDFTLILSLVNRKRDRTPQKVLFFTKQEQKMAKYHVDRDTEYMYRMWGTTSLITDYWTKPKKTNDPEDIPEEQRKK